MTATLGLPRPKVALLLRQTHGVSMDRPLTGRLILIAEDEPLVALDITLAFEDEGAWVIRAHNLSEALLGVENPDLSAAILDHALSDSDSSTVYEHLKKRNIPFITYSGYADDGVPFGSAHIKKPASMSVLVETVKDLLAGRQTLNLTQMDRFG
jgi:DNA-binding response OmpR family regulator